MAEEFNYGAVTAAGDRLIILGAQGALVIARATPRAFEPLARAQVLEGKCWTVPVLANGRLLVRNVAGTLKCLDLRP